MGLVPMAEFPQTLNFNHFWKFLPQIVQKHPTDQLISKKRDGNCLKMIEFIKKGHFEIFWSKKMQVGPLLLWAMAITQKIRRNAVTFLSEKSVLDTKTTPQLTLNPYNEASSTVLCNRFISTCKKRLFLIYDKNRSIPNYSSTFEPRFCLN